jgi:hypothetical protein
MTNRDNRKARIRRPRIVGLLLLGSAIPLLVTYSQDSSLPFSFTVSERIENLPEYVSPPGENLYNSTPNFKVGWGIDSPIGFVAIDGEVWTIFNVGSQYGTTVRVARYRGGDFEHTVRQPDGAIVVEKGVSTHFCGGMWYDHLTRKLYAPIHCEYDREISPPAGWSRKKTRLATSTDKGLTWHLEGDILTDCLPGKGDWLRFSGPYFEAGPADFDFFVDSLGGYFYIFSCNSYAPKTGKMNNFLWFNEVARCAISDKMAPGKWWKFLNGTWAEPGLAGKSSKVCMGSTGMYGRVIYSRYLKKYLRIGNCLGVIDKRFTSLGFSDASICVSSCDDLSRQEWTPLAKVFDKPDNDKFGYTLADEKSVDPFVCDRSLRVYNYWLYNIPSRALDVTLGPGATPTAGYPRYGSYAYEPIPESGDPIASRKTEIVGCANTKIAYAGSGWNTKNDPKYYRTQVMECGVPGSSVQYSFRGADIFWRAIADKDCGKADIYIDGRPEGTVDCYFQEAVPYQFAFIKTGLNPEATHTVRAVIRSDKNPLSSGTVIRHMAFESSAESYWASAGFCSIDGKNNWSYRRWNGREYADLPFLDFAVASVKDEKSGDIKERRSYAGFWGTEETCIVGSDFQVPTKQSAVRAWVAPHDGKVRSQGTVRIDADSGGTVIVRIMKNAREIWPSRRVTYWRPASHDFAATVKGGDVISFVAGKGKKGKREKVFWDPVITYEAK